MQSLVYDTRVSSAFGQRDCAKWSDGSHDFNYIEYPSEIALISRRLHLAVSPKFRVIWPYPSLEGK